MESPPPAIDYATADTPRPKRGGHVVLHEPDGLRVVHGPTGWGWRHSLMAVMLTALPVAPIALGSTAMHADRPGSVVFAFVMILTGVLFSVVTVVGWVYAYQTSKLVTEIRVGPKRVTRTVSDSKKIDVWPRESVAGFTVMVNPKNQYASLCLGTHDQVNPRLIDWLTQADAHNLSIACNTELAKPVPATPIASPEDHVRPENVPNA